MRGNGLPFKLKSSKVVVPSRSSLIGSLPKSEGLCTPSKDNIGSSWQRISGELSGDEEEEK